MDVLACFGPITESAAFNKRGIKPTDATASNNGSKEGLNTTHHPDSQKRRESHVYSTTSVCGNIKQKEAAFSEGFFVCAE